MIRGDARRIPLADESVDLVVTSPPYLDPGLVEFLGSEVTRLKGIGNLSGPSRATGTTGPDRQEGFRDQHFARPQAHERNGAGPLADSLVNNVVGLPEPTCCLSHRHHWFAGHDGWDRERLGLASRQPTNIYSVFGLEALDPKVRQQGFANHPSLTRRDRPMLQGLPAFGVRLGDGAVPIVEIKQQINSLRLDLSDRDPCLIGKSHAVTKNTSTVVGLSNADSPVGVNDSCDVSQFQLGRLSHSLKSSTTVSREEVTTWGRT